MPTGAPVPKKGKVSKHEQISAYIVIIFASDVDRKDSIQSPIESKEATEKMLEQIFAEIINKVVKTNETLSNVEFIQSPLI